MSHNKLRLITCRILSSAYDGEKKLAHFNLESEYGLYYPDLRLNCESQAAYQILLYDLKECIFWKVSYLEDTNQIIKMEGIRYLGCSIQ